MKKNTKIILEVLAGVILITMLCVGIFSASAVSDDPADNYVVQTAPNEDSSINMWFDYSFRKTFTSDTTSTGMNTFSIYMGKNEIESAQLVLFSNTTHSKMTAEVSEFTDGNGNSVPAEIYYEMYVTTSSLDGTNVLGSTASTTFIRAGETPDPVVPLANLGTFQLNAGKSQAFLIRATTTSDSVSGWYSAQLNIKDSAGNVVKTATVYLYVWNFEVSEKTALKTALVTGNTTDLGGTYTDFYNLLLENRLNAMDVPGGRPSVSNSYITMDRVAAVRITSNGGGNVGSYMESYSGEYKAMYEEFKNSSIWDEVKDKFYFYTTDEPMSDEQQTALYQYGYTSYKGATLDNVFYNNAMTQGSWPDAATVVPFHENHPYPYFYYTKSLSTYQDYQKQDAIQAMLDEGSVRIWCPQIYAFTPHSELVDYGYSFSSTDKIRSLSCTISALYYNGTGYVGDVYDWEALYGDAADRIRSMMSIENSNGGNYQLWAYSAGWNKGYSYCNHLIENTGLQTKMLFWQLYQEDVTGYLYYGTNNWYEYTNQPDTTVTGAKTTCNWYTNKHTYGSGNNIYGNGVLIYSVNQAKVKGLKAVDSLRVEILRDGVEEYQMMYQLAELKGDEAAKSYVNSVCNNVVDYISMPNYDRSAWSSSMDEYDIMEAVRRSLGNALEEATVEGECEHTWDDGTVKTEAGCITLGEMEYTCTKCGAKELVDIPTLHSNTVNMTKVESLSVAPTCTVSGKDVYQCNTCGYKRSITVKANHANPDVTYYESVDDTYHNYMCSVCGEKIDKYKHSLYLTKVEATCQEEGYTANECRSCGYRENETVLPMVDHEYVNGVCTMCGQPEHVVVYGDIDGNGKVNSADLNTLTKYITGTVTIDQYAIEAADVSGDGKVNSADSNYMIKYISGSIAAFPAEN